jgi:hypothetical protein
MSDGDRDDEDEGRVRFYSNDVALLFKRVTVHMQFVRKN